MKHVFPFIFILLTVFLFSSCFKDPPGREDGGSYSDHPHNTEYSKYLTDYRLSTGAPGAILYISKPGEPEWIGATGMSNRESNTAMRAQTQFRSGSITKVFISALIIKLSEEGKFSLTDKLSQVLPDVAAHIPSSDKITVKQLLSHLSGIIDPPNQDEQYQQDIITNPVAFGTLNTIQLLEKYVYGKSLLFEPGTQYAYSNAGYWILGLLAEKAGEADLQALLQQKIIIPLQLIQTYIQRSENSNIAREYAVVAEADTADVSIYDAAEADGKAAGGIVSTATDIAKFYKALFSGKLISQASLTQMETVQLGNCDNTDCEYGLGLEVWHEDEDTGYGHNGSLAGMEANALYFPEKQTTIITFKNLGGGSDKSFFKDILN